MSTTWNYDSNTTLSRAENMLVTILNIIKHLLKVIEIDTKGHPLLILLISWRLTANRSTITSLQLMMA